MRSYKAMIKQAFPDADMPKNFVPFFPERYVLPAEAWEMCGGEKEFERLRKTYPEIITTYGRGEKETATKFRLWEIQDAIQQEAKDQKKVIAGSKLNRRS